MNFNDLLTKMKEEGALAYMNAPSGMLPGARFWRTIGEATESCRWMVSGNVYTIHQGWMTTEIIPTRTELLQTVANGDLTAILQGSNDDIETDDLTDYAALETAELRKSNHDLAVLLGRVSYFLQFVQNEPIAKRKAMAKRLLDEINKHTGGAAA